MYMITPTKATKSDEKQRLKSKKQTEQGVGFSSSLLHHQRPKPAPCPRTPFERRYSANGSLERNPCQYWHKGPSLLLSGLEAGLGHGASVLDLSLQT